MSSIRGSTIASYNLNTTHSLQSDHDAHDHPVKGAGGRAEKVPTHHRYGVVHGEEEDDDADGDAESHQLDEEGGRIDQEAGDRVWREGEGEG